MTNKDLSPAKRALLEKWLQGKHTDIEKPGIPRRSLNSPVKLSFPQQRQLFLELLERGSAVNNLSVFIRLKGDLNIQALEKSANQILMRHEDLRTSFTFDLGLPAPRIWDQLGISIPVVNLQNLDFGKRKTEARVLAEKEVLRPFDLSKAPLVRLKLFLTDPQEYFLLITVHHTIADGWSLGVFLKELMGFYRENTTGQPSGFPELSIQYADYADWQTSDERQKVWQSSLSYWKEKLGGELPVLELPIDQARSTRITLTGGTYRFVLSEELIESLEQLGKKEDSTMFMTLLTAYYILLYRYSGQEDILIGTPIANRNLPELQELIGVFINTLVLRIKISGEKSFRDLLWDVRKVALEAYANQDLPFEKLVEVLKPRRDLSRTPLFQTVFNLQNAPLPNLEISGLEISFQDIDRGVSQFDLTLMISKLEGLYQATVEYNNDIFRPGTIERMFRSYQMLLEEAVAYPDRSISLLRCISPEELTRTVYERNQTQLDYPREKCFHELFEIQAEKTPDAIAVIYNQRQVSYQELNQRANILAKELQELGVGKEIRVGIWMKRSWEMPVALLAVHKAGGTYVPIHTSFPIERVAYILKDAEVKVLLTNLESGQSDQLEVRTVMMNPETPSPTGDFLNLSSPVSPDNLAYIIYTSGSTGNPKGVLVNHYSLVNFLWSMRLKPGINQDDVLMAVTSISFDIAALELFLLLITGATVVIADDEMLNQPNLLVEAIEKYQVSIIQATPATWQILIDAGWKGSPGLKALCGGEALSVKLAKQLLDRVGSLWNMYGPTETTIWSTVNLIQKGDFPITIGQPIGNTQIYILDGSNQPVPVNVVGELHIGGDGLARGYLNQPRLTEEKFIQVSIGSLPEIRLYRTGDYARYLEDGSIEVLGRMDDQVKIHGHRIELGEITAMLLKHPSVEDGIVVTKSESKVGKILVAYFVSKPQFSPNVSELREYLGKTLPSYMIPSFFISLPSLPLTPNGKINRNSLPAPDDVRLLPGYVAPRNEEEQLLAEIWQNVLNLEKVGIRDNFFDLGGGSMQSLQMVAKANMYGFRISVEHIFEHQTIEELSENIRGVVQKEE